MRKIPIALVILACICWVVVVILKTQTSLKTIICEGCSEAAMLSLGQLNGQNLFIIGRETLEEIVIQHDLSLVSHKKQLPHTLTVTVASNPPIYAIQSPQQSKTWKVTQAGLKVETTEIGELPLFVMEQEVHHQHLTNLLPFFLFISPEQPIHILTKNWGELTPKQGIPLIFNPSEPSQQKEVITYLLAHWPQTLPKDTKELDVRFRLPVARSVRTKPSDVWDLQEKVASASTEIASPAAGL